MHKKTIILFCLFLALLFVFAACKKHSPYGVIVVDQQGMEHVIMTDANGVTVIDGNGNLVEVMTDSNSKKPIRAVTENGTVNIAQEGEYETHAVTFPGILNESGKAENGECEVSFPENWEQIGNNTLILRNKDTDAHVMIYPNIGGTVTGAIDQLNAEIAQLDVEGFSQTEETLDGVTATRTEYRIGNMTQISYLLMTESGKVCRITCSIETDKLAASGVDAVVRAIHFK